ncbi:hypothetical protein PLICRDRAFT_34158 [Plicaturopsis crispa FD-325 SS-3]|nr:hypothetical protein PLICRDRAFT_34158 [Plicaturopsis crispa FD-325 SS-3]
MESSQTTSLHSKRSENVPVPRAAHTPAFAHSRVSVLLPTELLAEIFRWAYFDALETSTARIMYDLSDDVDDDASPPPKGSEPYRFNRKLDWEAANLRSWTVFPYSLAAVCPRWRAILSAVPEYWTRLVIDVGQHATPLSDVYSYLSWSEDLPIDVTILRREGCVGSDPLERARVAAAVRLLVPHLQRMKTFDIEVIDSVSLPSLGTDIRGFAPLLTRLGFVSTMDSGGMNRPSVVNEFEAPVLQSLFLDGENLRIILESDVWQKGLPKMRTLKVQNHASRAGIGEDLWISDVVSGLREHRTVYDLEITNVAFHAGRDTSVPDACFVLRLNLCHLTGLTEANLGEFLRITVIPSMDSFHIVSSTLPPIGLSRIARYGTGYLVLQDVEGDVLGFLRAGSGTELTIRNSRSFDDRTINCMEYERLSKRMYSLCVVGCPNVSGHALRMLAEARQRASAVFAEEDPDLDNFDLEECAICTLEFDGQFSEEDLHWLYHEPTMWSFSLPGETFST